MVTKKPAKSPKEIVIKERHAKPYRKRHLSSLVISLAAIGVLGLQTGFIIGRGQSTPAPDTRTSSPIASSTTDVRSTYGYSFSADANQFIVSALLLDNRGIEHQVPDDQIQVVWP